MSKVLHLFPPQDTLIDYCYELNTKTSIEEFIAFNKLQIKYLRGTWRNSINDNKTMCLECKGMFKEDETALVSFLTILTENDPTVLKPQNSEQIYHHLTCLKCHECNESLSFHGIYFLEESCLKTFCGRHFSQRIKPRCSGCDELIFEDEYTRAEGLDWHTHHFLCAQCNEPILLMPDQTSYTIMPSELVDKALAGLPVCNACLGQSSNLEGRFDGNFNHLGTLNDPPPPTTYINIEQLSVGKYNGNPKFEHHDGVFDANKLTVSQEVSSNSSSSISVRNKAGRRRSNLKKNCRRSRHGDFVKGCSTCSSTTANSKLTSNNLYQEPYSITGMNDYDYDLTSDGATLPDKIILPFGKKLNCPQSLWQDSPPRKSPNNAATTTTRVGRLLKAFARLKGPRFNKLTNSKSPTCKITMKHLSSGYGSSPCNEEIAPNLDAPYAKSGNDFEYNYGNSSVVEAGLGEKYQRPPLGVPVEEKANYMNNKNFTNLHSSIKSTDNDMTALNLLANMSLSCINEGDENPENNHELSNLDYSINMLECYDAPLLR